MLPMTDVEIALTKVANRLSNKLDEALVRLERLEEHVKRGVAIPPPAGEGKSGATAKAA